MTAKKAAIHDEASQCMVIPRGGRHNNPIGVNINAGYAPASQERRLVFIAHAGLQDNPYPLPTPNYPNSRDAIHRSQFSEMVCGRGNRCCSLCRLEYNPESLRRGVAKYGAHGGGQAGGDEGPLTNPVVVEVAVDGAEVIWEVNVDAGGNHGDQGEEKGVC